METCKNFFRRPTSREPDFPKSGTLTWESQSPGFEKLSKKKESTVQPFLKISRSVNADNRTKFIVGFGIKFQFYPSA